jgi:imidazolonepropionase-like amidohydrolase
MTSATLRFTSVVFLCALSFVAAATLDAQRGQGAGTPARGAQPARGQGQGRGRGGPITIHAARVLDGRGETVYDGVITVQGSKIVSVVPAVPGQTYTYDLGDATAMPGLIDVHVHLNWYFGPGGHYGERGLPAGYAADAILDNARKTLMAGFTTVQSVGWAGDKPLREAIAAGTVNGPRLLSSLDQIVPRASDTPDALRERVRRDKANGADLIKLFASASIRDGGRMNVTQAQIDAVCGEARAQGLRSLVHAHSPDSIIAAVKGGCTEIEHGLFADDAAIAAMKQANVYFDPNIGLVLQNYLENEDKFMGSGNFNEEGFAAMKAALPNLEVVFRKALAAGLRMPLGTDAVAGAHGQNAREIIARVAAGQKPMDAIIGATSLSAESLNLGDTIGTLAPDYEADIVAVPGNPLSDISVMSHVEFVMKGGRVYKRP